MDKYFLAQIIGCAAVFLWVISVQNKEQYKILYLQSLANLIYTIQYILLGVTSAASMNFSSTIRCYFFSKKRKENKELTNNSLKIFIILVFVLGIITYKNTLSLIPIIITLFYTISSWMKDSKWIRIVFIIAAFIWIYYNYVVGAYTSIIGNILEIISGTISLIRFKNSKQLN